MPILYLINTKQLFVAYSIQRDEVLIMRYVQPLPEEQRALLDKTMQGDASFRARARAHSLVLSAQGMTIKDIAKTYQVHRGTVSAWIKTWARHGAQRLHAQPRSGRPSTLTPDEQALAQHSIDVQVCFWKLMRLAGGPSHFLRSSAQTALRPRRHA